MSKYDTKSTQVYQSDTSAALQLTQLERDAALALKMKRPPVVPGSRAIINPTLASVWFKMVTDEMVKLKLDNAKVTAFCDLAGVPD